MRIGLDIKAKPPALAEYAGTCLHALVAHLRAVQKGCRSLGLMLRCCRGMTRAWLVKARACRSSRAWGTSSAWASAATGACWLSAARTAPCTSWTGPALRQKSTSGGPALAMPCCGRGGSIKTRG